MAVPEKLQEVLDTFAMFSDQADRINLLLGYADQFREVPATVATRPFPQDHLVPHCESEAYAWVERQPDGTAKLYFAVENPSGVSAKALATILDRSLSGLPPDQIALNPDVVEQVFRQNISMGKGLGLMSMVQLVNVLAARLKR
jgi:sulfur transfer protein SufE